MRAQSIVGLLAELAQVRIPKGSTHRPYIQSSMLQRIRAAGDKAAAYEQAMADRPNASASTRRKWRKAAGL